MNASWVSPVSRRSMLRIAAFASSVVASMPTVFPATRPTSASRSRTHVKTASCVSTSIQPTRPRQRRVIRRPLGHIQVQERPQAQRIGHPPRNPALRRQALEVADQQHPEIPPGTQTRSPHPRRVEPRAQPLDEGVEASLFKDLVQTLVEGMPSVRRQIRRRHPQRRPLSRRRSLAHCHAVQCTRLDRAAARPDPRLSPRAAKAIPTSPRRVRGWRAPRCRRTHARSYVLRRDLGGLHSAPAVEPGPQREGGFRNR